MPDGKPAREPTDAISHVGLVTQKLVGEVIIEWSHVDAGLNQVICQVLKLHLEDGRIILSRLDSQTKIAMLRKLALRHLHGAALTDLLKALKLADEVRDDRNFIAHGNWGTLMPEGVGIALSLRGKADPGEVKGETFPHNRLRTILRDILLVRAALVKIAMSLPEPQTE
jgi:hypothetical protein